MSKIWSFKLFVYMEIMTTKTCPEVQYKNTSITLYGLSLKLTLKSTFSSLNWKIGVKYLGFLKSKRKFIICKMYWIIRNRSTCMLLLCRQSYGVKTQSNFLRNPVYICESCYLTMHFYLPSIVILDPNGPIFPPTLYNVLFSG